MIIQLTSNSHWFVDFLVITGLLEWNFAVDTAVACDLGNRMADPIFFHGFTWSVYFLIPSNSSGCNKYKQNITFTHTSDQKYAHPNSSVMNQFDNSQLFNVKSHHPSSFLRYVNNFRITCKIQTPTRLRVHVRPTSQFAHKRPKVRICQFNNN